MPRKRKPTDGQVNFIGEVHNMSSASKPKVIRFGNGLAVVVSKVNQGASQIEREFVLDKASTLARRTRISPKFYIKKS